MHATLISFLYVSSILHDSKIGFGYGYVSKHRIHSILSQGHQDMQYNHTFFIRDFIHFLR